MGHLGQINQQYHRYRLIIAQDNGEKIFMAYYLEKTRHDYA